MRYFASIKLLYLIMTLDELRKLSPADAVLYVSHFGTDLEKMREAPGYYISLIRMDGYYVELWTSKTTSAIFIESISEGEIEKYYTDSSG